MPETESEERVTDDMKRILEKAIDHYGKTHQVTKCIEEIGEFLQALSKYTFLGEKHREWKKTATGPATIEDRYFFHDIEQGERHLQEEIADSIITMQQMRLIYGPEAVDWWIEFKLNRLEEQIEKEKKSV